MLVLAVLLLAALLFGVAAVSVGHGSPMSEALPDRRGPVLPDRVAAPDVEGLRFTMALRGYRMDEVDEVLDRLSTELSVRDAEISRLRAAAGHVPGESDPAESVSAGSLPADPAPAVVEAAPVADPAPAGDSAQVDPLGGYDPLRG